jgi:hypothetical protein
MEIGTLISIVSLVAAIGGAGIVFGVIRHKVDANDDKNTDQEKRIDACATKDEFKSLEKRVDEDRVRNIEAHKEIYGTINTQGREIAELKSILTLMNDALKEVKASIKEGFNKLEAEIKAQK